MGGPERDAADGGAGPSSSPRRASVRDLPPSIFAVVMATGIVAEAADAAGARPLAAGLLAAAAVAFVVLLALFLARCVRSPAATLRDARAHAVAPGFFTLVAAVGVLGAGCVEVAGVPAAGVALGAAAAVLWAALTYALLPGLIAAADKPPAGRAIDGTWFLVVVATQAAAARLPPAAAARLPPAAAGPVGFAALCFWLVGVAQYLWLAPLVVHRLVFVPLAPADLTPGYWIASGAMSISALAGATLVGAAVQPDTLAGLGPFLKGLTALCWVAATWWVPLLAVLGAWRHLVRRVPLRYDHGYWAAVFPLGMYATCTMRVAAALGLPFLRPVGEAFAWAAVAAWALVAAGLARRAIGSSRAA